MVVQKPSALFTVRRLNCISSSGNMNYAHSLASPIHHSVSRHGLETKQGSYLSAPFFVSTPDSLKNSQGLNWLTERMSQHLGRETGTDRFCKA